MQDFGPTQWRARLAATLEQAGTFPLADKESRTGTVFIGVCTACGRYDWKVSTPVPDDDLRIVIEDYSADSCADCVYVERRFPELGQWVQNAIKHQLTLHDERSELQMREQIREMQLSAEVAQRAAEGEGPPLDPDSVQIHAPDAGGPDQEGAELQRDQ